MQQGYFPFLANRKPAVSAANRMPLNRPSLKTPGNSTSSPARSWEEPQENRRLLLHSTLQNGNNQHLPSVAVNIDPPVRNKGATSVWWQINKGGGGQSKEKHTLGPTAPVPFFSLCVAQGGRRCLFGHPPFGKEASRLSAFGRVRC